jgi:hypothetical protein
LSHSLEVLLLLLRDQFNSFSAETLTSEADGHPRRLARQHWPPTRLCQTARARLTGIGTSFLLGLVSGEGSNGHGHVRVYARLRHIKRTMHGPD